MIKKETQQRVLEKTCRSAENALKCIAVICNYNLVTSKLINYEGVRICNLMWGLGIF